MGQESGTYKMEDGTDQKADYKNGGLRLDRDANDYRPGDGEPIGTPLAHYFAPPSSTGSALLPPSRARPPTPTPQKSVCDVGITASSPCPKRRSVQSADLFTALGGNAYLDGAATHTTSDIQSFQKSRKRTGELPHASMV